jgi:hypothetical protein
VLSLGDAGSAKVAKVRKARLLPADDSIVWNCAQGFVSGLLGDHTAHSEQSSKFENSKTSNFTGE